jgi:surface antigen
MAEFAVMQRIEGATDAGTRLEISMRLRLPHCVSAALAACFLLSAAAQAQGNPFRGSGGRGLSPEDNRLLFESIARLNAAQPSQVGRSDRWSNPRTQSSGTSTVLRVFHSGGMVRHLLLHSIVLAGQPPAQDYRLTWCRTPTGEWKIKS